jgi:hypothetical protein
LAMSLLSDVHMPLSTEVRDSGERVTGMSFDGWG